MHFSTFTATTFAVLTMVMHLSFAHTVRQAHHDLDMLIQTCKSLRNDGSCLSSATAEGDGVEIIFGLHILNEQMHFTSTKRIPKTEPYAPEDETAIKAKLDEYRECMRIFLVKELPQILSIPEMKQHTPGIYEQLVRYKEQEPNCILVDGGVSVSVDVVVSVGVTLDFKKRMEKVARKRVVRRN